MKLYEMVGDLLECLSDPDATVSANDLKAWEATLEEKVENCCKIFRNLAADEEAIRQEVKRLSLRATTISSRMQWLEDYLMHELNLAKKKKLDAGIFKVSIEALPMKIFIIDDSKVPEKFKKTESFTRIDRDALAEHIKISQGIPDGVEVRLDEHLRIR